MRCELQDRRRLRFLFESSASAIRTSSSEYKNTRQGLVG